MTQLFNYHTHTYRSGHSQYCSDKDIIESAKKSGFKSLGFSEHIPNPKIVLPNEDNRMLFSQINEYILSINTLKMENHDMDILIGFEAEYDSMHEAYLGEIREKVDYMILGQHYINKQLNKVSPNNNPDYPIEYANMVCKGIDSGIFDIVAHPDIFLKYRDTMSEENKELFYKNSILASQAICEKASNIGIPIEINIGGAEKNRILSDGNFEYPHPIFWNIAKEINGLKVLYGVDAHSLEAFSNLNKNYSKLENITSLVNDKLIKDNYNPIIARENNFKLKEEYQRNQDKALTYEAHITDILLNNAIKSIDDNLDVNEAAIIIGNNLNMIAQYYTKKASDKDKLTIDGLEKITEDLKLSANEKKYKLDRKKQTIDETNKVLTAQQSLIENIKNNIINVVKMGCESKEEIANIVTQIIEYNTTKNDKQKSLIEKHISKYQFDKAKKGTAYQLTNNGFTNVITLSLIVTFVTGILFGIGYMIYKLKIG